MRSTPTRRKNKRTKLNISIIISIFLLLIIAGFLVNEMYSGKTEQTSPEPQAETVTNMVVQEDVPDKTPVEEEITEEEPRLIEVTIAAAGDIMFHSTQLRSAYDAANDSYDFTSMFNDVKPILEEADLAIANLETTLAGSSKAYSGYPHFNSPDSVLDAIQHAGIDVLVTANNHSLDTGKDGLKRTAQSVREKGLYPVGTYDEAPDSRVVMQEIEGVHIAILAYTESTNTLGDQYPREELNNMINMMTKENIERDIEEAKELGADFIITFMHWGEEYQEEPNDKQVEFAQFMAEQGVDLILGSHPHVIQKSDVITTSEQETVVIYSLGNFISNQRQETLGDSFALTEDGVIAMIDIVKNDQTGETTIQAVDYVPTWVLRDDRGNETYTYRILPIENFLVSNEISDSYKKRMERSLEATTAKMERFSFE